MSSSRIPPGRAPGGDRLQEAGWVKRPVPRPRSTGGSVWDRVIPDALIRQMRLTPGETYLLTSADGRAKAFTQSDLNALAQAARMTPFRVQSRRVCPTRSDRHVWVSFDPAYNAQHPAKSKREEGS